MRTAISVTPRTTKMMAVAMMTIATAERARFLIDGGKPKERKPQPRNRAERRRLQSLGRC